MPSDNKRKRGPMGPGPRAVEKPKNFKNAMKKMAKYLKGFMPLIIVALLLASLSSIFSIVGPNKLSDLTNEITTGITVNKDDLEAFNTEIFSNLSEENIKNITTELLTIKLDNETISKINMDSSISLSDKQKLNTILANMSQDSNALNNVTSLPESILKYILPESKFNDILVSTDDKIALINLSKDIKDATDTDKITDIINLPLSIKQIMLPTSTYKDKEISTEDKLSYLNTMSSISDVTDVNALYSKIDELPESIKDVVKPYMNFDVIKNIFIFLLTLYLISSAFNFIQSFIMATVSNNFAKELRSKISHKINKLPLKYFDNHSYGDILSRVTNDVDTIGMSMYQSLGSLIGAITLFLGSIIMMFVTNWIMAITAILSSLLGFIFMFVILGKSQKYFTARQVELGKLNGHIEEIYSSHNVVKAYNGEDLASEEFDKLNESVYVCNKKSQFLSGLMPPMMGFIGNFGYVCVCVVGALLVKDGSISFGVIVAFMIYVRLFTNPLSQIAQGMTNLQTTAAASERVFEFIEEKEMDNEDNLKDKLDVKEVKGNINFEHVKFGYNSDRVIINDFSSKVKPGEKVAIVGPTGAGKTTMVNLLMKFYNITDGDITIDDKSIHNLTRENIHELFIMVLQDTWLFNGTIRDNIKYNKEDVTDEQIWEALKTVGVDHFVKSLPKGLDYALTDNDSISAGQKQLLTIARGMIKDAPFLILDEATSSVDTRTEELVQKAMDKLTKGRTSFIIAHRLSTIKNANMILVMKDGNIIEQGNHEELLKKNGFYADLYNSQFEE